MRAISRDARGKKAEVALGPGEHLCEACNKRSKGKALHVFLFGQEYNADRAWTAAR